MNGGTDWPEGKTGRQSEREHARRWRNGNTLAIGEHWEEDSGPNELKLSDRGWRGQTQPQNRPHRQPLFAGARGWAAAPDQGRDALTGWRDATAPWKDGRTAWNDAIRERHDTTREENGAIRERNDAAREGNGGIREGNGGIREGNGGIRERNDAVREGNGGVI